MKITEKTIKRLVLAGALKFEDILVFRHSIWELLGVDFDSDDFLHDRKDVYVVGGKQISRDEVAKLWKRLADDTIDLKSGIVCAHPELVRALCDIEGIQYEEPSRLRGIFQTYRLIHSYIDSERAGQNPHRAYLNISSNEDGYVLSYVGNPDKPYMTFKSVMIHRDDVLHDMEDLGYEVDYDEDLFLSEAVDRDELHREVTLALFDESRFPSFQAALEELEDDLAEVTEAKD